MRKIVTFNKRVLLWDITKKLANMVGNMDIYPSGDGLIAEDNKKYFSFQVNYLGKKGSKNRTEYEYEILSFNNALKTSQIYRMKSLFNN